MSFPRTRKDACAVGYPRRRVALRVKQELAMAERCDLDLFDLVQGRYRRSSSSCGSRCCDKGWATAGDRCAVLLLTTLMFGRLLWTRGRCGNRRRS